MTNLPSYNQGDMFLVVLRSVERNEGEMEGHTVELSIANLTIDPLAFEKAVQTAFATDKVGLGRDGASVTMVINAEKITDGKNDFTDTEKFLEGIAGRIVEFLKLTGHWGEAGSANRRELYDLLD